MTINSATADIVYSRLNTTMLSLQNISASTLQESFALPDLLSTLQGILSADTNSLGELNINSTTTTLITYALNAINGGVVSPIEVLRAWLISPFIMFQENSYTNPWLGTGAADTAPLPGLADELYTTAEFAQIVSSAVIAEWTVILYLFIALLLYLCCVVCLICSVGIQGPPNTNFPLIDFASRAISKGFTDASLATVLVDISNGDEERVREKLSDRVVFLGDVDTLSPYEEAEQERGLYEWHGRRSGTIGFSLTDDVGPLKPGKAYD